MEGCYSKKYLQIVFEAFHTTNNHYGHFLTHWIPLVEDFCLGRRFFCTQKVIRSSFATRRDQLWKCDVGWMASNIAKLGGDEIDPWGFSTGDECFEDK